MQYFFLSIVILSICAQDFFIKKFKESHEGHSTLDASIHFGMFSSAIEIVVLLVIWHFTGADTIFHAPTIGYSAAFAVCFAGATLFTILAIATGPLALTGLLCSYSLLLPTFFGIVFFKEQTYRSVAFIVGLIALCVSVFLIQTKDKTKATGKWWVYIILAFISNGLCNIIEALHQNAFPGEHQTVFLAYSMVFVEIIYGVILMFRLHQKVRMNRHSLMTSASANGTANACANFFLMTLIGSGLMQTSIIYPVISAGQFTLLFLISFLVFGERFTVKQYIGYVLGALAVVLLNMTELVDGWLGTL